MTNVAIFNRIAPSFIENKESYWSAGSSQSGTIQALKGIERIDRDHYFSVDVASTSLRPLIKRRYAVSGSTDLMVFLEAASARKERQGLLRWLEDLNDSESESYEGEGQLAVSARDALEARLIKDGSAAVAAINQQCWESKLSDSGLYAICDGMGRMRSEIARQHAARFLADLLRHPRVQARDAAALGISLLGDRLCAPAVKAALDVESSRFLRETLTEVLEYL